MLIWKVFSNENIFLKINLHFWTNFNFYYVENNVMPTKLDALFAKETKTLEFPSTAFLKIFALLGIFYILAEAQGYFDKNA